MVDFVGRAVQHQHSRSFILAQPVFRLAIARPQSFARHCFGKPWLHRPPQRASRSDRLAAQLLNDRHDRLRRHENSALIRSDQPTGRTLTSFFSVSDRLKAWRRVFGVGSVGGRGVQVLFGARHCGVSFFSGVIKGCSPFFSRAASRAAAIQGVYPGCWVMDREALRKDDFLSATTLPRQQTICSFSTGPWRPFC